MTVNLTITKDAASFGACKEKIGNSLDLHIFSIGDTGHKIHARLKITTRNGLIHTKYLHAGIDYASGKHVAYREQSNGEFKPT